MIIQDEDYRLVYPVLNCNSLAVMGEDLANKTPEMISKMQPFLQFRDNVVILTMIPPKTLTQLQQMKKNLYPY